MRYIEKFGQLRTRKMYLTEAKAKSYGPALKSWAVEPVVVRRWHGGTKDAVDIAMAMDAVEIAIRKEATAVAIVARDVDFALVHRRVRGKGLASFHVFPVSPRAGPPKGNPVLLEACSGVLVAIGEEDGVVREGALRQHTPDGDEVVARLVAQGYLQDKSGDAALTGRAVSLRMAVATFVEVHGLAEFAEQHAPYFYPQRYLPDLHTLMQSLQGELRSKPEGLWCFEGIDNYRMPKTGQYVRTWPSKYLMVNIRGPDASSDVLREVLEGLGYLDGAFNTNFQEATDLFLLRQETVVSANKLVLREHFEGRRGTGTVVDALRELFLREDVWQQWRLPHKDLEVRRILVRQGVLAGRDASQAEVMSAMERWLSDRGEVPLTYNMRVWRILEAVQVAKDPNRRKAVVA